MSEKPPGSFRHPEICSCRESYDVQFTLSGTNYLAYCVECGVDRDCLDKVRFAAQLGLTPIAQNAKTSMFDQSRGQQKITKKIADGECAHCVLARTGKIRRRPVFRIPGVWVAEPTSIQTSLFAAPTTNGDPALISLSELSVSDRDHIFQRRLHEHIEHHLTSSQNVLVRRHWLVSSCAKHNSERASIIEGLPYLMHLFALYLAAKDMTIADAAEEAQLFVECAKIVHTVLRVQAIATQREA